jgi:hypothetical protein
MDRAAILESSPSSALKASYVLIITNSKKSSPKREWINSLEAPKNGKEKGKIITPLLFYFCALRSFLSLHYIYNCQQKGNSENNFKAGWLW